MSASIATAPDPAPAQPLPSPVGRSASAGTSSASVGTSSDSPAVGGHTAGWSSDPSGRLDALLGRIGPAWVGLALFLLALVVYLGSDLDRRDAFDHFVWQADAFLHGRAEIAYPVSTGPYQNDHFQDVLPLPGTGLAQIPFPPLPALILLPFVAVFGLGTNAAVVAAVLGALNVALCWAMLLGVTPRRSAALLGTIFYGFGTVAWYAATVGTTWFLAHVVASTFLFLAITAAVRADRELVAGRAQAVRRMGSSIARQVLAGLLFGTAALARLTTLFGAPFFVFVGGGGTWLRRAMAAGFAALLPVLLLAGYNVATTGHVFHPAYEYLYRVEYRPRPALVNPAWGIEDPRYIPQNAVIMLAWPPSSPLLSLPACRNEPLDAGLLFDRACPLLRPDPLGMSILLTSPAYLVALPVLLRAWRHRLVAGSAIAVLAIALVDLMHFSQGWVQFGYRFSNDFAPFAMILVALGIARRGADVLSVGLVALSIAINAWGVHWGVALGW